ncbi:coiled-coil domain-containing protein 171-like [Argonauta hians]
MTEFSDSMLGNSQSESNIDWNKYQIQVKELQLDLASERESAQQFRRKWNNLVSEKLELTTKMNNELTTKNSEIVKLQSEIEKNKAERQNIDYNILKVIHDQKLSTNHVAKLNQKLETENTELKDEVQSLTTKLGLLQNKLGDNETVNKNLHVDYECIIKGKDLEISKLLAQMSSVDQQHQQEKAMLEKRQESLTEMVNKCEADKSKIEEELKKSLIEVNELQEKELHLQRDLNTAFSHIKSMEINIESERETHLETKFNTEVVQMHVRDLDQTLQMERNAAKEAQRSFEDLSKKYNKLQISYEELEEINSKYKMQITELQEKSCLLQNKMKVELNNKNSAIYSMSKETEMHLENFHILKDELSKAKKRQIFLEEKNNGCMKELDLLVQNFQIEDKKLMNNAIHKAKKSNVFPVKSLKATEPPSPTEQLRKILTLYRQKINKAAEEEIKQKSQINRLTNEIDSLKEIMKTKDKTLEESQANYTQCTKDLCRLRLKFKQMEEETLQLKTEVESDASLKEINKIKIEELNKEISNLKKVHQKENEDNLGYLYSIYQRLLTEQRQKHLKAKDIREFSWFDLTLLINEQVALILNSLQNENQRVCNLEDSLRQKESSLTNFQKSYEEQLSHIINLSKERELSWQKQKREIQCRYESEIKVINNQIKDKQAIAEKAIDKMKCSTNIHKELESKCKKVQELLYIHSTNNAQLQIVCCLLCSLFCPLYTQILDLIMQCHILKESVRKSDSTFSYLRPLIQSFNYQFLNYQDNTNKVLYKSDEKPPILRFRCCVIAVLAANRLIFLLRTNKPLLSAFDVALGPVSLRVQTIISQNFRDSFSVTQFDTRSFLICARGTLNQIASIIAQNFQKTSYWSSSNLISKKDSLSHRLACGLKAQLQLKPQTASNSLLYQNDMIRSLQNYSTDLNKHIKKMASDFHQLKQQLHESMLEKNQLELDKSTISHLQEQLKQLHEKQQKQVSIEKLEKILSKLKSSMLREQQSDQLLKQQSAQLTEVLSQVEEQNNTIVYKENILTDINETLSKCKESLNMKEQSLYELKKEIKQHNSEKADLKENLLDAERTLKTAAEDKLVLQKYLKSVHYQFNHVKKQFGSKTCDPCLSLPLLLKAEHIPTTIGKAAPELIACQNLVKSFVESHIQALRRVTVLEGEVNSLQKHITSLKTEFSNSILQRGKMADYSYIPNNNAETSKSKYRDLSLASQDRDPPAGGRQESKRKSLIKKFRP